MEKDYIAEFYNIIGSKALKRLKENEEKGLEYPDSVTYHLMAKTEELYKIIKDKNN